jgi:hypothetical protein
MVLKISYFIKQNWALIHAWVSLKIMQLCNSFNAFMGILFVNLLGVYNI